MGETVETKSGVRRSAGIPGSPRTSSSSRCVCGSGMPPAASRCTRAIRPSPAFTECVWREQGHTDPQDLDVETALEVVAQIAYTTFANYAADVTGAPVDEVFTMP